MLPCVRWYRPWYSSATPGTFVQVPRYLSLFSIIHIHSLSLSYCYTCTTVHALTLLFFYTVCIFFYFLYYCSLCTALRFVRRSTQDDFCGFQSPVLTAFLCNLSAVPLWSPASCRVARPLSKSWRSVPSAPSVWDILLSCASSCPILLRGRRVRSCRFWILNRKWPKSCQDLCRLVGYFSVVSLPPFCHGHNISSVSPT